MKIEPRGKYPGVKVHLDEKECEELIKDQALNSVEGERRLAKFGAKLVRKILTLQEESPTLLQPRTEDQIRAELIEERDKSIAKLAAMDQGQDWKKVKI